MTENEFYMLVGGTLGKREKKLQCIKRNPEFLTCETKVTSPLWVWIDPSVAGRGGGSRSTGALLRCVGKQVVSSSGPRWWCLMPALDVFGIGADGKVSTSQVCHHSCFFWLRYEGARYQLLLHLSLTGQRCISYPEGFGGDGTGPSLCSWAGETGTANLLL